MLKNCVPAPRAVLVQYRVLPYAHTRAALVRIRPLLRHVIAARDDIRSDNE